MSVCSRGSRRAACLPRAPRRLSRAVNAGRKSVVGQLKLKCKRYFILTNSIVAFSQRSPPSVVPVIPSSVK